MSMENYASREELLKRIYKERKGVINWVRQNSGSLDDGEDVLQEAIIIYLKLIDEGKLVDMSDPMPMITTLSRRYWLGILRKRKTELVSLHTESLPEDIGSKIDDAVETERSMKLAFAAFSQLGEQCKNLLKLFYFEKQDMKKIASILGFRNEHVARSMKYKCLDKARQLIFNR